MAAALLLYLFHACGLASNGYLAFRLLKSWNTSASKNVNKVISVQLLLNICNIISHAALEVSKTRFWIVMSTNFSFQTVYFLAAIEVSLIFGRPAQQRLNSFLNIAILTLASTGLSAVFGRKYEICGTSNCFDNNSKLGPLSAEDDSAILKSYVVHFLLPTSVILFGSFYIGFRKYERMKAMNPASSCVSRLVRLCASSAVALFLLYGTLISEVMLHSTEVEQTTRPRHMCRVTCLYEELYLLLSMFPVGYVAYFLRQNEGKQQQEQLTD